MNNNANLPRLFDDRGHLIEVDTSKMDAATRARHAAVVNAHQANKEAQAALDSAQHDVTLALAAVEAAESFHDAHWPRQSFMDLWRDSFSGGPRNTKRAMGLIE